MYGESEFFFFFKVRILEWEKKVAVGICPGLYIF